MRAANHAAPAVHVGRMPVQLHAVGGPILRDTDPDLAVTPETRRGPWIEEAFAAIKAMTGKTTVDAVDVYQYVHNTIDIEWYYGSKKGAEATFLDGAGSDFDASSLCIALLRAIDVPARYVYSTVRINAAQARNITGADTVTTAYMMMRNAGFPAGNLGPNGFEFEHVFASAYVPMSDPPGLGLPGPGVVAIRLSEFHS